MPVQETRIGKPLDAIRFNDSVTWVHPLVFSYHHSFASLHFALTVRIARLASTPRRFREICIVTRAWLRDGPLWALRLVILAKSTTIIEV